MNKLNKGFGLVIILIIIALVAVIALFFLKSGKSKDDVENRINPVVTTDSTPKPMSTDDSYTSIEADLDNTIISEEDFSDL